MRVLTVFVTIVLLNGCLDETHTPTVYSNPVQIDSNPAISPQTTACLEVSGAGAKFDQFTQVINNLRSSGQSLCDEAPTLEVTISGTGARFRQVTVEVNYHQQDEPLDWTYAVSMGIATRTDNGLSIVGDGRVGDGILTIQGEEYLFTIEDDPICEPIKLSGSSYSDCDGYLISSVTARAHNKENAETYLDWIWYGNEDTTVVTWEIAFWQYNADREEDTIITDEDARSYKKAVDMIATMNDVLLRSGVYAQFELKYVVESNFPNDLQRIKENNRRVTPDVDIAAFYGISYSGTCGVAYPARAFERQSTKVHLSKCTASTLLHEIGHTLGLAHGPNNSSNKATGYIYSEFGHGNMNQCGDYSTTMSYGQRRNFLSNADLLCSEAGAGIYDDPAGDRNITDEAHALNKIRYMVALINDENRWEVYEKPIIELDEQEQDVLID